METHGSPDECGICDMKFNEKERCPCIFACGHTLCKSCIAELIKNTRKQCPFCRQIFHIHNLENVTVNYNTLDFMKYYSGRRTKRFKRSEVASQERMITNFKEDAMEESVDLGLLSPAAVKQREQMTKEIQILKGNITQETQKFEEVVLPKVQDAISTYKRLADILDCSLKILHCQPQVLEGKISTLQNMNSLQSDFAVVKVADEVNREVNGLIKNFQNMKDEKERALKAVCMELEKMLDSISNILDDLKNGQDRDVTMSPVLLSTTVVDKNASVKLITTEAFQELKKHLVEGEHVFAVKDHVGRSEYARLSLTENNKLCLHYLTERHLPPNSYVVEHKDLLKLLDPSSRLTFLELSIANSTLGRLYIDLFSDSAEARNFTTLCTGELGECYVNTNILEVNSKGSRGECVSFGDYENNDGSGGKALVPGAGLWTGNYKRPWLAGTLEGLHFNGEAKASQFNINMRDNPGNDINPSLGIVVEGLNILKDALDQHTNIVEVRISDCGIVLPTTSFL